MCASSPAIAERALASPLGFEQHAHRLCLSAVDEREVLGQPLAALRSLILGVFQSMVAQQSLEEEVETLRVQLRQALSHCAQVINGYRDMLHDSVMQMTCSSCASTLKS